MILHKAQCEEIRFTNDRNPTQSPESDLTPNYYKHREYLAWFKLTSINQQQTNEEALNEFSYIEIDDFFDGGESHFKNYDGKVVSSTKELRFQDRTIWFVRNARQGDPHHEIVLVGATVTDPAHFPPSFRTKQRRQLLWLSDLHFGEKHAFPDERAGNKRPLWLIIEEASKKLELDIGGVLISGDITVKADPDGYDKAYSFIEQLSSHLRLENYDFIICPGNHDFGFSNDPLTSEKEIEEVTEPNTQYFSDFYKKLFYLLPNDNYFASGRRFLLANTYPVEIIALNTVRLQQTAKEFQGYGFVGTDQLGHVEERYNWGKGAPKVPRGNSDWPWGLAKCDC